MNKAYVGHKIIHLSRVDSTNNYTANVFKSGEISSGTVIMADNQTNGRGQRENTWQSKPFENITMSFPLDLNLVGINQQISINHIICLAIKNFISPYSSNVKIKWPNDIMVKGNKIAGVLIENSYEGKKLKHAIIGIGINVNQTEFPYPNTTSLKLISEENYNPKLIVFELINCINNQIDIFSKLGAKAHKKIFDESLWLLGKKSKFEFIRTNSSFEGEITGTSEEGLLKIIDLKSKKENTFRNGEIKFTERK